MFVKRILVFVCVLSAMLSASALIPKRLAKQSKPRDSFATGLRITAGETGFAYVANQIVPVLLGRIRNLALPTTISGEQYDFDYHVDSLVLQSVDYTNAAISLVKNVLLTVSGLSVTVTGNWGYKLDSWPHWPSGSGGVTVSVSNSAINIQGSPVVYANGSLGVSITNVIVEINSVSISCSGSPFDWLYNLIADAAKGDIKSAIQSAVQNALVTMIPQLAQSIIDTIPLKQKVADNLYIDTRLTFAQFPDSQPGWVSLGGIGSFETATSAPSTLPHALLPLQTAPSTFAAIDIDAYVFNSLFQLETLPTFNVYDKDPQVPLNLNTATFKPLLPALYAAFPDYTLMFQLTQASPFSLSITPSMPTLHTLFNWTWSVSNDKNTDPHAKVYQPAFTLTTDVDLTAAISFNLSATPPAVTLTGQVSNLSVALASSNIGTFPTSTLQNFLGAIVKGVASKLLVRSFPLPTVAGLSIQSPAITYGMNYATALVSFSYTPPQSLVSQLESLVLPNELVGFDSDSLDTVDTS